MARTTIDRLIVNSPYEEPAHHWRSDRTTRRFDSRRAAAPPDTSSPPRTPAPSTTDGPSALLSTARTPDRRTATDRPP